ncbi:MAG: dockerin type I domain-containing protein [Xylanibacter rarus]
MRKNVLVSLLAVTSASTMPAWANADVDQIKTDAATDWEGASDLELESGLIVSPSGATVTQNIGKLYPGTYTLTAETNENAKILVDGKELAADGQFKIDAVKDVTISIESKDGSQYKVGGFKLTLVYNFANAKSVLTSMLSEATSKIYAEDEAGKALLQEASSLATKVAAIADDNEDSYAKYIEYGLYAETLEESAIYNEIAEFSKKVDAQANNSSAYAEAKKVYEAQTTALATAKAAVDAIADADEKTYVEAMTKGAYDTISEEIEKYKTEADAAYAKGTAGVKFTTEYNNKFVTKINGLISDYSDAIESAQADHAAYVEVGEAIATIKTLYTESQQEIYSNLQGDETHPDVYEALRTKAQTELNAVYVNIMTVEKANGTDDNHAGAATAKEENLAKLAEYTTSINVLKTTYVAKAKALKEAYTKAKAELKGLQDRLDALKKTPGVGDNAEFAETISEIQASIDAFSSTIEADNKENTIDSKDYSETVSKISIAIDELTSGSQGAVDNYNAWVAVTELLKDKQKEFDDAKKVVNALVSTDKAYVVSGKYATEEAAIQKSIDGFKSGAETALKEGTCVKYQTDNTDVINEISATVAAYQQAAKDALDAYEIIVGEVANCNMAIAYLEEKVTNRSVYVYAESTDQKKVTYGDKIDGFKATIKEITTDKDAALDLEGKEHSDKLIEVADEAYTAKVEIEGKAETLVNSYDTDKAKYDEDVVSIALEKLLAQATTLVEGAYGKINAYSWSQEELGLSHGDINNKKAAIEAELRDQESKIEGAKTESDKAAAMAVLTSVTTEVSKINTKIDELIKEANGVKEKVQANKDAKTAADKVINGIVTQLLGNRSTIKGVEELNEDASRADEFTAMVNELNGKIDEQRQAVNDADATETLVAAWADSEDEEGNKVEGIESKLNAISADVEAAREAAQASTANYKAYTEIQKTIADLDIDANITKATDAVAAVEGINAEAKAYYDGLISGYSDNLATLKQKALDAYSGEDRNCAEISATIIAQLKNLNTLIKAVGTDAKNNQTTYEEQVAEYKKTNEYWSETYYKISTGDQTSIVQEYLKQLTEQQTALTELNAQMLKNYNEGKSVAENENVLAKLNEIKTTVKAIADTQEEGYNAAVAADNKARYDAFTATVKDARNTYNEALTTIAKFSALTNSELVSVANEAVTTANAAINGILTDLRVLESNVSEEYLATVSPAIFDAAESHKAEAETYITKINDAVAALDNAVSTVAKSVFSNNFALANAKLDAVITELTDAGYNSDVIAKSFSDVRKIVADANKDFADKYFALSVDAHLNAFATIDELLVAGKEDAAQREWTVVITAIDEQVAKESADLKVFEYIGDADGTRKQQIIDSYDALVEATVTAAKNAYTEVEKGNLYASLPSIKALLAPFESSTIYSDAKAASQDQVANKEAYNAMKAALGELQASLEAAAEFVNGYVITVDCGEVTAQNLLNTQQSIIDRKLSSGGCVDYYDDGEGAFKTNCAGIEAAIASIYVTANDRESLRLADEIVSLKGDQNKAAAAVEGTDKVAEVDAYIEKINSMAEELEDMETDADFIALDEKDKQPKYLEFETKIATMRAELAAYYDANLAATTIETLNSALAEVESKYNAEVEVLNGCHENVQKDYTGALAAVKTSIDNMSAEIAKYAEAGSILFYEGKLSTGIAAVEAELAKLTQDIADAQKPYDVHKLNYDRLTKELGDLQKSYDEVVKKFSNYAFTVLEDWGAYTESIEFMIKNDRDRLVENPISREDFLDDESDNFYANDIKLYIETFDLESTYYELFGRINVSLRDLYNSVNEIFIASKYTSDKKEELKKDLSELDKNIIALFDYNNDACDNIISKDIYGNDLIDEDGNHVVKSIDYMTEAVPAVWERYGELTEQLNSLKADAEGYAYILGDVNRDGSVLVDDYTQILNYVLEVETVDEGSMEYFAADVNEDGNINIGDVTAVTNAILGNNNTGLRAVARYEAAQQGAAGSLELATESNGDVTRVAVRINGSAAYVGAQMDIKLPAGVTLLSATSGSSEHNLYQNTLADGTQRVVVSSMQNIALGTNGEAVVLLELAGKVDGNISIANVFASDARGIAYSIDGTGEGTTGIGGVDADKSLKDKIYSVGGQVIKTLKKGVNILRGSDGSTKKVLRK